MGDLRAALLTLRDHGYQPTYNGRPSCPFCEAFLDDGETHETYCVLVTALAVTHDHETTWCARCVEHGVVEQVRREDDEPKANDDAVTDAYKLGFHTGQRAAPPTPEPTCFFYLGEDDDDVMHSRPVLCKKPKGHDGGVHLPSTPESSGLREALAEYGIVTADDFRAAVAEGGILNGRLRAAPSTEPALDAERLALALRDHCHDSADEGPPIFLRHAHIAPFLTDACAPAIARRYTHLAESD